MTKKEATNNIMTMSQMMIDVHFTITGRQAGKVYIPRLEIYLRSKTSIIIIITTTATTITATTNTIKGTTLVIIVTQGSK